MAERPLGGNASEGCGRLTYECGTALARTNIHRHQGRCLRHPQLPETASTATSELTRSPYEGLGYAPSCRTNTPGPWFPHFGGSRRGRPLASRSASAEPRLAGAAV